MKAKMFILIFLMIFLFALPGLIFSAPATHVVINSFRIGTEAKTTDEYVEIFNPTTVTLNLQNYRLSKKVFSTANPEGKEYDLVKAFPATEIKPGESIVVGHKDSTEPADISFSANSITDNNTIFLYGFDGKSLVDEVGFGSAKEFETAPISAVGNDIWSRTNGLDTDNNAVDFKKVIAGGGDYTGICLSEVMPRPAEGDEWIEIYNSETTKDIGGLIISDKLGATKKFTVPTGTMIKEKEYLVFKKADTGITLNDDSDGVILIDSTGKIFDDSGNYTDAQSDYSYSFSGKEWKWTAKSTPGSANIIDASVPITSKKRSSNTTSTTSSLKGTLPEAAVLGATASNENNLFGNKENQANSKQDQFFGYILIGVALLGGLIYTISVNRQKLIEVFNKERERYYRSWEEFRSKLPRR